MQRPPAATGRPEPVRGSGRGGAYVPGGWEVPGTRAYYRPSIQAKEPADRRVRQLFAESMFLRARHPGGPPPIGDEYPPRGCLTGTRLESSTAYASMLPCVPTLGGTLRESAAGCIFITIHVSRRNRVLHRPRAHPATRGCARGCSRSRWGELAQTPSDISQAWAPSPVAGAVHEDRRARGPRSRCAYYDD